MQRIEINNGHVIDPANKIDRMTNIYIAEGNVVAVADTLDDFHADHRIDATNLLVFPGCIDLFTNLREPGFDYKATIAQETRAAAKAGITTLCCSPETNPVIDTPAVVDFIAQHSQASNTANVLTYGALTQQLAGQQLACLASLKKAGCVAMTNAFNPIANSKILRHCFEYAATFDLPIIICPQDAWLAENTCAHEGKVSARLGLPSMPAIAESMDVARCLELAKYTNVQLHFSQLSTCAATHLIRQAKNDGMKVTADVSIQHLILSEIDISDFNANCHMLPPLRSLQDQAALQQGLQDGTLDAICSSHHPHDSNAKNVPFSESEPGVSSLETLLPLSYRLVTEKRLTHSQWVQKLTANPARIIRQNTGALGAGQPADIVIFDPHSTNTVTEAWLHSAGKNTPFLGWELVGAVKHTLHAGCVVFG